MAANGIIIEWEDLREIPFGDISDTIFTLVGNPSQNPTRVLKVINETDTGIYLSFDGITPKDYYPAKSGEIFDIGSNKSDQAEALDRSKYTRFYVMSNGTPTEGSVFVVLRYAKGI